MRAEGENPQNSGRPSSDNEHIHQLLIGGWDLSTSIFSVAWTILAEIYKEASGDAAGGIHFPRRLLRWNFSIISQKA